MSDDAIVAGAGALLAKPLVEAASSLLVRMLGKPVDALGELAVDQIKAWQWRNRVRIFSNAAEILQKNGATAQPVPPAFLIPLFEASGMVDDTGLQQLFSELIARANSDSKSRQPIIVDTLRRMSPEDAIELRAIRDEIQANDLNYRHSGPPESPGEEAVDRLVALGILTRVSKPAQHFGEEGVLLSGADDLEGPVEIDPAGEVVVVTGYGRQFLAAVGMPISVEDPDWYESPGVARFGE